MRLPSRARALRGDDGGSALVLALVFVLLVGTLFAAAIDYTRTGLLVTPGVRNDRNEVATIQSAVDGAINNIRGSSTTGKVTTPDCPDFVPPLPSGLPGVDAAENFRVTCTPQPPGGSAVDGAPPYAIQALGTAPEGIRQIGNDELVVTGGVYSKGVIGIGGGAQSTMSVTGSAVSEKTGGCTGRLLTTDLTGPRCGPAYALFDGGDPGYGGGLRTQAELKALIDAGAVTEGADPVPTCTGTTASFKAGYYRERPDLLLARTRPSCTASVWRFAAGLYYFDYEGVWDLGSNRVVFGAPSGSDALGEACDRDAAGSHLVFGGESRIFTSSSAAADAGLEVCGPVDTSYYSGAGVPQRISVYGLRTDLSAVTSGTAFPTATSVTSTGSWLTPGNALKPDTSTAGIVLQKGEKASLTWTGFANAPKGARVTKVSVELTHTVANAKSAQLTLTGPGGVNVSQDVDSCGVCNVDITSQLEGRRTDALWRYLTQLTATYEVEGKDDQLLTAAASLVNGLRLVVEYTTPALRAQTCPGSPCWFIQSASNANVFVHGTVYTPAAAWSVRVHNAGETIFDRGVVLRDLRVDVSGSTKQATSPFQLPHTGSDGRKVLFRGYVDSVERVRACVQYVDKVALGGGADTQAFPGYSLSVTQWLVFRQGGASAVSCPS